MTDRLTDEQVVEVVKGMDDPAVQDIAWTPIVRSLAREVQEHRFRRCDGCAHGEAPTWPDSGLWCQALAIHVAPDHACNAWQAES